ncbi:hypothetical protein TrLO_g15720 [Triparma laevis f. longispina]|uniref:Uncharacterized protein n=1 Tax=Triparma laevis f. longispina TaxID=1714387 RepID=A0A9W7AK31_9STRA|nr:hypothetical protein TrLO_g15720 [Triparma laevis f. longispina]
MAESKERGQEKLKPVPQTLEEDEDDEYENDSRCVDNFSNDVGPRYHHSCISVTIIFAWHSLSVSSFGSEDHHSANDSGSNHNFTNDSNDR